MTQLFNTGILLNLKRLIKKLPIAVTRNQQYDVQTKQIIQQVCKPGSNSIDVGTHTGDILDLLIQQSPEGVQFGFEPIPALYKTLKTKYAGNDHVELFDIAVTNEAGETSFNYVTSNPSYSGIKKRKYDRSKETDTIITVKQNLLDEIILPFNKKIGFIKIDVEGAEMAVLKGASALIRRDQPVIVFECGLGGTDVYDTTPEQLYDFFHEHSYHLSLMKDFLQSKSFFSKQAFAEQYYQKLNYYFVASPFVIPTQEGSAGNKNSNPA